MANISIDLNETAGNLNNSDINSMLLDPTTISKNDLLLTTTLMPDYCEFIQPPLTEMRFWLVTIFGTSVALISIFQNCFFFYVFSTRKHHRTTYNMYMMFLTLCDVFISGAYILLMSMNVLSDYLQSPKLVRIWFSYMVPILTVSHCGITASSFLILAATFERYCLTLNVSYVRFIQRNRKFILLFAIFFGLLSKGTIFLEFKISYLEECAGLITEIQLSFAEFVYGTIYNTVWRFWYRNFVTVFFPFLSLLILNIRIVKVLTNTEKQNEFSNSPTNQKNCNRKKVARSATRTTVLVVFTYLISNIINVALTTWEHLNKESLINDYVKLYTIALDLASLNTILACALRPPIYLICQPTLRREVFGIIKNVLSLDNNCSFKSRRKKHDRTQSALISGVLYSMADQWDALPALIEAEQSRRRRWPINLHLTYLASAPIQQHLFNENISEKVSSEEDEEVVIDEIQEEQEDLEQSTLFSKNPEEKEEILMDSVPIFSVPSDEQKPEKKRLVAVVLPSCAVVTTPEHEQQLQNEKKIHESLTSNPKLEEYLSKNESQKAKRIFEDYVYPMDIQNSKRKSISSTNIPNPYYTKTTINKVPYSTNNNNNKTDKSNSLPRQLNKVVPPLNPSSNATTTLLIKKPINKKNKSVQVPFKNTISLDDADKYCSKSTTKKLHSSLATLSSNSNERRFDRCSITAFVNSLIYDNEESENLLINNNNNKEMADSNNSSTTTTTKHERYNYRSQSIPTRDLQNPQQQQQPLIIFITTSNEQQI